MKKKNFIITIILLCLFINHVSASCNTEELNTLKQQVSKVKITYQHLGAITKEDGSVTYDEFLVTTKNIPEDIYIHLYPMTSQKFEDSEEGLNIKLTTGNWEYNFYSSKCDTYIDTLKINLPKFNIYSLDPLCNDIDSKEFKLCSKYYEYDVSREDFEQRINAYRKAHIQENKKTEAEQKTSNIINLVMNFISKYNNYILISLAIILFILVLISYITRKKNKKILQ